MRSNYFIIFLASLLLNACSQNSQDMMSTAKEAFWGADDADISQQEILNLPYASCYISINKGPQLFIVLAFAEPSVSHPEQLQLKWLSADKAMLVTENGRLVKTLRLPTDNLAGVTDSQLTDPLLIKGNKPEHSHWQAVYDWQPDYRFNYPAEFSWDFIEEQTLQTSVWKKETLYYQERVTIPSLNTEFTNHFWLDKQSHQVVKSIQSIGPEMSEIEMTILKPFSG